MVNYFEEMGKVRNLLHEFYIDEETINETIKSMHKYFVKHNHLTEDYRISESVFEAVVSIALKNL